MAREGREGKKNKKLLKREKKALQVREGDSWLRYVEAMEVC